MSKLVQLRQRIKTIETIKKITHAMRLISMSTHSQLKHEQNPLTRYAQELEKIFFKVNMHAPLWHNSIIHPKQDQRELIILVSSQKGLCGSFNTALFKFFENRLPKKQENIDIIGIGQKAFDFLKRRSDLGSLRRSYEKFTHQKLSSIAQEVTHTIMYTSPYYSTVTLYSNTFKSFFLQRPHATQLIPLKIEQKENSDIEEIIWEQSPTEILTSMVPQYIESKIQLLLFESLLAEHAARFISMDQATRNANNLLETTRLDYNKLRQAKITKELTELSSSY